ncbi:MAG: type I DNA topoisomerase [Lactobacillales bacterium]|jgi:DNA topoisomerase-1|nr:type I DNA topoisomerase [Lactobacillales bacterium]
MKLVIVESPSKAKTINKYLGKDYQVMASFGHIRDLPAKSGSVRPDKDFEMDWEVQSRGEKTVKEIVKALAKADALYLASDPDREGEAIAWHVVQELKRRKKLKDDFPVYRVVFHEITKNAILAAMKEPRPIDMKLVDSYLARRALDYLVGFNLSPVLWRKLPGAKSAGRVQSVALRLIAEREDEIQQFIKQEYWTIDALLDTPRREKFKARLTYLNGKKLDKFDLANESVSLAAKAQIEKSAFSVGKIEKKQTKRNPAPAFTTSTIQQEASRKLGFSAKKTMQVAQSLYEGVELGGENVGLITYMRTDSVALAKEAMDSIRTLIEAEYGKSYLPEKPRFYKNNSKNAQEAHEAIRPTDIKRRPDIIANALSPDQKKLYELIWKRTLACQMESALLDRVSIDIPAADNKAQLRATGQTIAFAGFIKVYKEDIDDANDEDENNNLPPMDTGEDLGLLGVSADQHFTEPPPRYSEASLVKKLEELGIGRPSTYASILSVLQDRKYVKLVSKRFIPEDTGRIVTAFLENYFNRYVQYDYTALLENKLDDITNGETNSHEVLTEFWTDFDKTIKAVEPHKMGEVLETVAKALEKHLFPTPESRICPCEKGTLSLKIGRYGAFIGCSNYPTCTYTKPYASFEIKDEQSPEPCDCAKENILGKNELGQDVTAKKGPYGWYVQAGTGKEAKRTSIPKSICPEDITITQALQLLTLPRALGADPKSKEIIEAGLGKFGPYVRRGKTYKSLEATDDVLTVDLKRALELLSNAAAKSGATVLGKWNDTDVTYQIGRYGPYVKNGKVMASVKNKSIVPTLEEAITLLQEKIHQK